MLGPLEAWSTAVRAPRRAEAARVAGHPAFARQRRRAARRADRRAVGRDAAAVGARVRPELRLAAPQGARGGHAGDARSRVPAPRRSDPIDARRFERPSARRARCRRASARPPPRGARALARHAALRPRLLELRAGRDPQPRGAARHRTADAPRGRARAGPAHGGDRRARRAHRREHPTHERCAGCRCSRCTAPIAGRTRLPHTRRRGSRSSRSPGWSRARSFGRSSGGSCRTTRRSCPAATAEEAVERPEHLARKVIAVCIVELLVDDELDVEAARGVVSRGLASLEEIVLRHGGTVEQLLGRRPSPSSGSRPPTRTMSCARSSRSSSSGTR